MLKRWSTGFLTHDDEFVTHRCFVQRQLFCHSGTISNDHVTHGFFFCQLGHGKGCAQLLVFVTNMLMRCFSGRIKSEVPQLTLAARQTLESTFLELYLARIRLGKISHGCSYCLRRRCCCGCSSEQGLRRPQTHILPCVTAISQIERSEVESSSDCCCGRCFCRGDYISDCRCGCNRPDWHCLAVHLLEERHMPRVRRCWFHS